MTQDEAELINDLDLAMAQDGEHWITTESGSHLLIDGNEGDGYTIKGGAGGKLNGQKIQPKSMSANRINEKTSAFNSPDFKPHEPSSAEPKIPNGHERLTSPMKVVRETEKAYAVTNQAHHDAKETAQYDVKELSGQQIELLRNGSSLTWLPKSHSHVHEGHVVSMSGWLAKKNNHETHESKARQDEYDKKSEERFNAGVKRYEELIAKATAAGVKGVRSGMRTSTIKEKMSAAVSGEKSRNIVSAGKKMNMPQYMNIDEKVAQKFGEHVYKHEFTIDSNFKQLDSRGQKTDLIDSFVKSGLISEGDNRYKHRLSDAGREICKEIYRLKRLPQANDHGIAFDQSMRHIDPDGRMRVEKSHISKACVNPYVGSEIPNYEGLGLQADKVYHLLRDPQELEKAVPTFVNLPLLSEHVPVTADEPRQDLIVGSTGSDVEFDGEYVNVSLSVWDAKAIAGIETKEKTELSSAYRYTADMTPGEFNGVKYDGVMRDIIGNHVALVDVGRAGRDVVVSDRNPFLTNKGNDMKRKGSATAQAKVDTVIAQLKPKLAQDADVEDLTSLLDALAGEPVADEADNDDTAVDSAGAGQVVEFLKGKLSDEDLASVAEMLSGSAPQTAGDEEFEDNGDKDKPPVPPKDAEKPAMDAAMVEKIASQRVAAAIAARDALYEARSDVESLVGKVALDSAEAVYKFALDHAGVDTKDVHPSAYKAMVAMVKSQKSAPSAIMGMDSASVNKAEAQFPDLKRFQ